jgi:hypothetical protein
MSQPRRSLRTILIASASSAGAAVLVRTLWAPGTVLSAALMPMFVAVFDELLYWHTEHLSYLARERLAGRVPSAAEALHGRVSLGDPARVRRVIVITATAFLIGGAALTAAELLVHHSLATAADRTTLLGGSTARQGSPTPDGRGTPTISSPPAEAPRRSSSTAATTGGGEAHSNRASGTSTATTTTTEATTTTTTATTTTRVTSPTRPSRPSRSQSTPPSSGQSSGPQP